MYYRWQDEKLFLECSIQARAGEDKIVGPVGDCLKIRISAPPSDGKANKQLIKFLSGVFKVRQSDITIVSGHSSRKKRLCISNPGKIPVLESGLSQINEDLFSRREI
ncbi:MAG: YggU family protein [Gammaproteobacteria bacterium]|jgi:hypothetical protein|nr:YggU family protein [Gammaproteobacteria bacterium]MBT3860431.1 YggU family protein [Gammaproteobacteria bacterium]MBT3988688.1 YggU family protein [Gammaproteobacteria bacterium]MBT4581410.1 YggU family protein [Gammaproteobacteria bacterium]MBT4659229.1 YggU family protein [Gammaproteobacteria bacterium]